MSHHNDFFIFFCSPCQIFQTSSLVANALEVICQLCNDDVCVTDEDRGVVLSLSATRPLRSIPVTSATMIACVVGMMQHPFSCERVRSARWARPSDSLPCGPGIPLVLPG